MRFSNSLRNSALAFAGQIVTILTGFVIRWLFVRSLGKDYLGVNSVMESMVALLSMTELGIGTSVAFALYRPIDDGNLKRIGSLMAFYRKAYHIIGITTALLGPMLIPFMRFFTREAADRADMNLIYILFLTNTVLSYFFAYKRTLLSAYQQNYINSVTEDAFAILKYVLQGVAIVRYRSYVGYLLINVICSFLTNAVISFICGRKYPFIEDYKRERLTPEDSAALKKSVVSLMFQKISGKIVTGTDNLLISCAKLSLMGIYSNYAMIINIISRVAYNVLSSVMGSVGSLMVQEDNEHKYNVFEEFTFAAFAFYFLISIGLASCMERFIALYAGDDWLLSPMVTLLVILNAYLTGMRQPCIVVIEAAGLFNRLRLKAVGEAAVNFAVSFLLLIVFKMGIYGVLFGTTVSMASVCIWWEALAVHKYSFGMSMAKYFFNYAAYLLTAAAGCFAGYFVSAKIPYGGIWGLVLSGFAAFGIYGAMITALYGKNRRFKALAKRFAHGGKKC